MIGAVDSDHDLVSSLFIILTCSGWEQEKRSGKNVPRVRSLFNKDRDGLWCRCLATNEKPRSECQVS